MTDAAASDARGAPVLAVRNGVERDYGCAVYVAGKKVTASGH
jgi:hypothetical protein